METLHDPSLCLQIAPFVAAAGLPILAWCVRQHFRRHPGRYSLFGVLAGVTLICVALGSLRGDIAHAMSGTLAWDSIDWSAQLISVATPIGLTIAWLGGDCGAEPRHAHRQR